MWFYSTDNKLLILHRPVSFLTCYNVQQWCGVRARICPLPENSKENEDIHDVELDHLIIDLVKVIFLRILQIMHSSRRAIPHPQGYICYQCQHAQQGSGLRPALGVSLIYLNVHMLY